MRLTFLGTGSAMPTGERHQTGLLLEEEDQRLLVDCGSGVLHRLAATDAGYEGIDGLLLTHHHLDHVSDLMPLLKARWLAGATEFSIAGPEGTEKLVADLLSVHEYMQDRLDLAIRDVTDEFSFAGFDVAAMETRHSMRCLAYRFEGATGDLTFSGDSEAFDELAAFAAGSSILVHDCSFPEGVDVSNHPTPAELGEVLANHEYGTVYLSHLYPHTDGHHEAMLDAIGARYDGEVRFARDGVTIQV